MTICSQICSIVDKIRPVVGILIGVGRFAMGVANFLIVMNEGYFIFTLPIIFLLNGIFMLFCTCGLFMKIRDAQKRSCIRCHFYFVILLGSAVWILNIKLLIDGKIAEEIYSEVFPAVLIVTYILDIFITIKITENYKILCTGCLDKGIKGDA